MANTDQLIIDIWHKSDLISPQNFGALLRQLVTTKTVPDVNKFITELRVPQQEQKAITDIINILKDFVSQHKKKHSTLFTALQQLYDDLKNIDKNIDILQSFEVTESSSDHPPALWKDNIIHLNLNKMQKACLLRLNKLYNSKKISSFKLAKNLYSILITPQKSIFSEHFKKYFNYAQFYNENLKNEVSGEVTGIALEAMHSAFEHQDEQKSYSYIDYITTISNSLSQSTQRQFQSVNWYMAVWTLVTFLKKHDALYKTNPTVKKLCNDYGLSNVAFKEFYDALSSQINEQLKLDLKKTFQAYFEAEKKSDTAKSDDNFSEKEEHSRATKRKKRSSNESVKQPFQENPGFDDRIKQASEKHIPKTSYFDYSYYSQSTEMSNSSDKKYKVLANKLAILPRKGLSDEEAYKEGVAIKKYLIDKCHLSAKSEKNILVQPIKQDAKWREENTYELRHNKQDIEIDCTIDPRSPVGTVVARGYTILTIVSKYYPLPTGFNKDKMKNVLSTPTKKSKANKLPAGQHPSLLALANVSSVQSESHKSDEQEESTGSAITPARPKSAPKSSMTSTVKLHTLFSSKGTPTPYEVTPSSYSSAVPPCKEPTPDNQPPAATIPVTPLRNPEDDIILISDDETKELNSQLAARQKSLAEMQRKLSAEQANTAKQKSDLLTEKKRKQRESLSKLDADLRATQNAIEAEREAQQKLRRMSEELSKQPNDSNASSPALSKRT